MSELEKQFQILLFEEELLITTPSNNNDAFKVKLKLPPHKKIKIGWHDWLETSAKALNYHECCGVLILFGIQPPTYVELCNHLKMKTT